MDDPTRNALDPARICRDHMVYGEIDVADGYERHLNETFETLNSDHDAVAVRYLEYAPGDMTRYTVFVVSLPATNVEGGVYGDHSLVVAYAPWHGSVGARAHVFANSGDLATNYINEKMPGLHAHNAASFWRTCQLIAHALERPLIDPADINPHRDHHKEGVRP